MNNEIKKLIQRFGSQNELARALNISQAAVSAWLNEKWLIPAATAIKLEVMTGGKVKAKKLRPDLFKKQPAKNKRG